MALLQKAQQSTKQAQDEAAGPTGGNPNATNGAPNSNSGGEGRGRGNAYRRRQAAADGGVQAARDANIELINVLLEALEKEHECLYQSIVQPVIAYVNEVLPEPGRTTADAAKSPELAFEDLEKLMPDDAAHVVEWLTEKVDALSTKLKADPKEEEEVSYGGALYIQLIFNLFQYVDRLLINWTYVCMCILMNVSILMRRKMKRRAWVMLTCGPWLMKARRLRSMKSGCSTSRWVVSGNII